RHVTLLREGGRVGTERLREPALHGNRRMRFEEPHECRKRRRRGGNARRSRRRGRWRGWGERAAQQPDSLQAPAVTIDECEVLLAEQAVERLGQRHVLELGGDLVAVPHLAPDLGPALLPE